MKKLIALVFAALLLGGCFSGRKNTPRPVNFDITGPVLRLDPQFAALPAEKMIVQNIFEGLVTRGESAEPVPAAAEGWTVSPDGKTLTFKLRRDGRWLDGSPVTAADFVFAFKRMFRRGAESPHAGDYLDIKNAKAVLSGRMNPESLGLRAEGPYGLVIQLERPSPMFLDLLAEPAAMPCNEGFFLNSRGRYGTDLEFVDSNGPLFVDDWDRENLSGGAVYLRPNKSYVPGEGETLTGGVNLRRPPEEEDALTRLLDGDADAAYLPYEAAAELKSDYSATAFEASVWCVVFNQNSRVWGNPLLRQGLALATDREMMLEGLPERLSPTELFLPPTVSVAGRGLSPEAREPAGFSPQEARYLYELGRDALPGGELTDTILYTPNPPEHLLAAGMVQQGWQKHLGAYLTVAPQTMEQILSRFNTGDYGLMIMPFTLESPRAEALLEPFISAIPQNGCGYANSFFDAAVDGMNGAESLEGAAAACAGAEGILLKDAVIIPLYCERSVFASSPDIEGAAPSVCLARLNFKHIIK